MSTQPASGQAPAFDTSVAHQARIYNHWLGGKDNYAADRRAADEAAAAYPGVVSGARANREFAILHAISDDEDPWGIVASLLAAVPAGSYLVMSQPASDIDPDEIAEATKRLNRLSHQEFTLRGHAGVSRFFDGLELLPPGVVRVEEWRPCSDLESCNLSAMWGGVGRKP